MAIDFARACGQGLAFGDKIKGGAEMGVEAGKEISRDTNFVVGVPSGTVIGGVGVGVGAAFDVLEFGGAIITCPLAGATGQGSEIGDEFKDSYR